MDWVLTNWWFRNKISKITQFFDGMAEPRACTRSNTWRLPLYQRAFLNIPASLVLPRISWRLQAYSLSRSRHFNWCLPCHDGPLARSCTLWVAQKFRARRSAPRSTYTGWGRHVLHLLNFHSSHSWGRCLPYPTPQSFSLLPHNWALAVDYQWKSSLLLQNWSKR